jgi:hypothetical protein
MMSIILLTTWVALLAVSLLVAVSLLKKFDLY